jgi:hypothetical protein
VRGGHASDVDQVLHRQRQTVQPPQGRPGAELGVAPPGVGQDRVAGSHRDERVVDRVEPGDPVQEGGGDLDGAERASGDRPGHDVCRPGGRVAVRIVS